MSITTATEAGPPPVTLPATEDLAALFRGLAEPARLKILRQLVAGGPQTVSQLVVASGQRQPSVSKHLACLHGCGLAARERQGRIVTYRVAIPALEELLHAGQVISEIASCGDHCSCSCCDEGRCP